LPVGKPVEIRPKPKLICFIHTYILSAVTSLVNTLSKELWKYFWHNSCNQVFFITLYAIRLYVERGGRFACHKSIFIL
jgi:hypothetical protein